MMQMLGLSILHMIRFLFSCLARQCLLSTPDPFHAFEMYVVLSLLQEQPCVSEFVSLGSSARFAVDGFARVAPHACPRCT